MEDSFASFADLLEDGTNEVLFSLFAAEGLSEGMVEVLLGTF